MLAIGEFSRMTHLSIRTLRRYHPVTLPAAELVATTHQGDHEGIGVTYGELGSFVTVETDSGNQTETARTAASMIGDFAKNRCASPRGSRSPRT